MPLGQLGPPGRLGQLWQLGLLGPLWQLGPLAVAAVLWLQKAPKGSHRLVTGVKRIQKLPKALKGLSTLLNALWFNTRTRECQSDPCQIHVGPSGPCRAPGLPVGPLDTRTQQA